MLKAIIFDKDGTLIELGETWDEPTIKVMNRFMEMTDLTKAEQKAFALEMGIEKGSVRPNSLLAAGSINEQAEKLSTVVPLSVEELNEQLEDAYLKYVLHPDNQPALVEGAIEVLEEFKENYILAIVTNDNRRIAEAMLEQLGIADYFSFLGCSDDYQPKPNPEALFEFSKEFDIKLNEMIYIGDSTVDMLYGQHTKGSIGLALRPEDRKHLQDANYIVESLNELPALINQIEQEL